MSLQTVYGWKGLELTSGPLTVGLTPSIGGRIMSLKYKGHELLFHDARHEGRTFNPKEWTDLTAAKKTLGFSLWGGDKTWVAPEKEWLHQMPSLDLDAAPYEFAFDDSNAVMTSMICRETGMQIVRRISLKDESLQLTEEMYNRMDRPARKGLWNVTMLQRPCALHIPAKDFRCYHQDDPTLSPYEKDLDSVDGVVKIDCHKPSLFKIGGMVSRGEVQITTRAGKEEVCWTKRFDLPKEAVYAHGSMVEVYNSPDYPYAEIELHAPLKVLNPGDHVSLTQRWEIHPCSSKI